MRRKQRRSDCGGRREVASVCPPGPWDLACGDCRGSASIWFKEQPGNAGRVQQERHTYRAGRVLGALLLLLAVTCAGAARAPLGWVSVCKGWRMGGHQGLPLGVPLASSSRWLGRVKRGIYAPIRKAPDKEGGGAQPGEGHSTCRASWGGGAGSS